jgi:hypothetical protein
MGPEERQDGEIRAYHSQDEEPLRQNDLALALSNAQGEWAPSVDGADSVLDPSIA